jgi:lipopolysaccharide heptosyltransferase II
MPNLDREALVMRNRRMAAAFHAAPPKHRIRHQLLELTARFPLRLQKGGKKNRILLIRPDHLGDVLLTTPAIHALRTAYPHVEIHALVGPWSAEMMSSYPEVDRVLTLPFPGFSRRPGGNWRSPYELALRSARHLRLIGYDSAVILRPDHWWGAMLAWMAGIPERQGYNLPDVAPFLSHPIEYQYQHAVLQGLRLVERWAGTLTPEQIVYDFPVQIMDNSYIEGYLREWRIEPDQPVVCIHPGSGTWAKQWQENKWAKVADTLADQLDAAIVLTGGDHELPLVGQIAAQMKRSSCIMVGDTRIGQLAALFARAKLVLGADSGPLHLAAAVGTPTVTLFGPADPVEFGPWGKPQRHITLISDIGCRPCRVLDWGEDDPQFHPCVREITVAHVLEAARRVAR